MRELKELGATLAAVTPQLVEHNRAMRDKHALNFQMLTDPANAYAAKLGLRFEVPDDLKVVYTARDIDLPRLWPTFAVNFQMPVRFLIANAHPRFGEPVVAVLKWPGLRR